MNFLQMVSLIPLFSMNFPAMIIEYSKFLTPLHGEPGFLPNIFEDYVFTNGHLNLEAYNDNFMLMGFSTKYFIMNTAKKILLTLIILFMLPIIVMIYSLGKNTKSKGF